MAGRRREAIAAVAVVAALLRDRRGNVEGAGAGADRAFPLDHRDEGLAPSQSELGLRVSGHPGSPFGLRSRKTPSLGTGPDANFGRPPRLRGAAGAEALRCS